MQRRDFNKLALAAITPLAGCAAEAVARSKSTALRRAPEPRWKSLESASEGLLGVAVTDEQGRYLTTHRPDERFPMCSTFKWVAAAFVLRRVDEGIERLERRMAVTAQDLEEHSPVCEKRVGSDMTLGELCDAAVTLSDNAAGNLLHRSFGGPQALTRYVRGLGDQFTRFDRIEPGLNDVAPSDPRDTTTPAAMASLLHRHLLGDALGLQSRRQLTEWMLATRTGDRRLRAGTTAGWRVANKTGTGQRGATCDVGVAWNDNDQARVIVAYLRDCAADSTRRDAVMAEVGRAATT